MITDTCVDPTKSLVEFLIGKVAAIGSRVYGYKYPDALTLPAMLVEYMGATQTYIRVKVQVKAEDMIKAMDLWTLMDAELNFQAPWICGLNNGFVQRPGEGPTPSEEKNTKNGVVSTYYLIEMGG